jgi:predicted nucleic acid-binding protein
MTFLSCLTNPVPALVLDSSVVINLLATKHGGSILRALSLPLVVTENVVQEIRSGTASGRPEFDLLMQEVDRQTLRIETLSDDMLPSFFDLVSGSTISTLGDGEAATIAYAQSSAFAAAIDEKKATRIASERFAALKLVTTVDILAHAPVRDSLGKESLGDAIFDALRIARMQVRDHQFDWIRQQLGEERVAACPSLKKLARQLKR